MNKKDKPKLLTKQEEKLWNALKAYDTVAFAAQSIGFKPKTAYNMLYRLRQKYLKARRFVNFVEGSKRGCPTIRMVMTSRREMRGETELEEKE